jgi:anti-anti-sigma factor
VTFCRGGLAAFDGRDADRTLVSLRGDHDASTAGALSEALSLAIALDDADVVVDLSGVAFMSAATVRVIVGTRELLRSRSRSLTLRCPSTHALRVLDACGVTDLIDARLADVTRTTATVGAPSTWVATPAGTPFDHRMGVSASSAVASVGALVAGEERLRAVAGRGGV